MARILIGGFDRRTAAQLAIELRVVRHDVWICEAISEVDRHIVERGVAFDLVVVDGTTSPCMVEKCIKAISKLHVGRGPRAMLLCVSRAYHGPRFEIDLENQGARLVYFH